MRDGKGEASRGLRVVSAYGDRRFVGPPVRRRAFGVPPGGPFDRLAAALANALAGLPDEAPVLEIALGPVVFEAEEPYAVAVVGGPDGAYFLAPGERLEIRPVGARAYVAANPLGPVRAGGSLRLADPLSLGDAPLRVLPGPQASGLDLQAFLGGIYAVGLASNRVGVRLQGETMPHNWSLPSEPAVPGVVQIPPSGEPIVLGPDGPTIGGYPKIAVVVDADLDRLARARPGDRVRFTLVSPGEARRASVETRAGCVRRSAEIRVAALGWSALLDG